jgi:hypothetical protein
MRYLSVEARRVKKYSYGRSLIENLAENDQKIARISRLSPNP